MLLPRYLPGDQNPVNEKQVLFCSASSGSFAIRFRNVQSADIPYNSSPLQLQTLLQSMLSYVSVVDVCSTCPTACAGQDLECG